MKEKVKSRRIKTLNATFTGCLISALACMWIAFGVCAVTAIFTDSFLISLFGWMTYIICTPVLAFKLTRFFYKNYHLLKNGYIQHSKSFENNSFARDVNGHIAYTTSPSHPFFDEYNKNSADSVYYRRYN